MVCDLASLYKLNYFILISNLNGLFFSIVVMSLYQIGQGENTLSVHQILLSVLVCSQESEVSNTLP